MKILYQEVQKSGELNPNSGSNTQQAPVQAGRFDQATVIKNHTDSDTVKSDAAHQIL